MQYPVYKNDAEWKALLAERGAEPGAFEVTRHSATERPFTGKYEAVWADGSYHCICCGNKLFESGTKFDAGCGWPSFDDEIPGAVRRLTDADGRRVEIVCGNCGGHLGHVFEGERFTPKDTRHCVNSISMGFVAEGEPLPDVIKP